MTNIHSNPEYRKRVKRVLGTIGFQGRNIKLLTTEQGETPLVIALPNEDMQDVLGRLIDAGGQANIVVAFPKKVVVIPLTSRRPDGVVSEISVTTTMSVGMFIQQIQKHGGKNSSLRIHVEERNFETEFQSVNEVFEYAS